MSYQLDVNPISGVPNTLQSLSGIASLKTVLAAGLESNDYAVTCFAEIFDGLDARRLIQRAVKVLRSDAIKSNLLVVLTDGNFV